MKPLIQKIYAIYAGIVIAIGFLLLYPLFELLIHFPKLPYSAASINRFWARFTFPLWLLPVKIEDRGGWRVKGPAILVPNHFSYLDIPLMSFAKQRYKYVGKKEITKVPLFGRMFSKLHITVDRKDKKDAMQTYFKVKDALDDNFSVIMFPEGGIRSKNKPEMVPFKDGPFKIAIEKNVPLIPVTIVNTWKVLPGLSKVGFFNHPLKLVFHEPISTDGLKEDDFEDLKEQVYTQLQEDINIQHSNGDQQRKFTENSAPLKVRS